jgi:rhodanese-related sulfurtransferase
MRELTPLELKHYLENADPPPLLLDVREPGEFEICHIAGSQLMPMGMVAASVDDIPQDRPIVVICHHGMRSYSIARYLEQQGFDPVMNLSGGLDAWARSIDFNMQTY